MTLLVREYKTSALKFDKVLGKERQKSISLIRKARNFSIALIRLFLLLYINI